jgi:hypothetical protein
MKAGCLVIGFNPCFSRLPLQHLHGGGPDALCTVVSILVLVDSLLQLSVNMSHLSQLSAVRFNPCFSRLSLQLKVTDAVFNLDR